jgi:hypothetical protein
MRHRRRRGRALRRRYGRTMGPQAISRPAGGGKFDVIVVDSHGTALKTLARSVPYSLARTIIRRRHG